MLGIAVIITETGNKYSANIEMKNKASEMLNFMKLLPAKGKLKKLCTSQKKGDTIQTSKTKIFLNILKGEQII